MISVANNSQILNIDEDIYNGDDDMKLIIQRLHSAAYDVEVRQAMNVEDEYFKAIENRDEAIMLRDKKIAERDATIAEKDNAIAEKDDMLKKTIKMLVAVGTDLETIAVNLNVSIDDVEKIACE